MTAAFGVLVFFAAALYDLCWARYLQAAAQGKRIMAACWSVTVYLVGLVGLVGVLDVSSWMIIPEVAGLFVGTVAGVRPDHD